MLKYYTQAQYGDLISLLFSLLRRKTG